MPAISSVEKTLPREFPRRTLHETPASSFVIRLNMHPQTAGILFNLLLLLVGGGAIGVWARLLSKGFGGEPLLPAKFRETVKWIPRGALILALAWIITNLWMMSSAPRQGEIGPEVVLRRLSAHLIEGGLFTAALAALLWTGARRRTDLIRLGFRTDGLSRQCAVGFFGFLASLPLVFLMRLVTLPLQSEELVHPLLRIIEARGPGLELWPVVVLAVVLAPLQEELLFRVVLQSWLERLASPTAAILVASLVFAAVHGFPDSLGILPLAAVLGYVYWRERSFVAVVVLHACFNALNLLLTVLHTSIGD